MINPKQGLSGSVVFSRTKKGAYMTQIVLCDDDEKFLCAFRQEARSILELHKIDAAIHTFRYFEEIPEHLLISCDIFFLDIDFFEKSYTGIDIARRIRLVNTDSVIVFVTNYLEYAPEGYEVQAFRYLLKDDIPRKLTACILDSIAKLKTNRETLEVSIAGETFLIPLNDILYIESQKHVALIHVHNSEKQQGKVYRYYSSLSSLESKLSSQGFLRIQKSYLVNMRRIQQYQCHEVLLDTGTSLRASVQLYSEQKKRYLLWKGRQ